MKELLAFLLILSSLLISCRETPKSSQKKTEISKSPMPHVNSFMQKYVDEDINIFYRHELDKMNNRIKKSGADTSILPWYRLNSDTVIIKGLNCTIYTVNSSYMSDQPFYFLIRDNCDNQVYKYMMAPWCSNCGELYTSNEALVLINNTKIAPLRPDLSDFEAFLNRCSALKYKFLSKEQLDSISFFKLGVRIKDRKNLDQLWKDLNDKYLTNDEKIDYQKTRKFIEMLKIKIDLPNVLIYKNLRNTGVAYIDFSPDKFGESAVQQSNTQNKEYAKTIEKGNLYKLRVFNVSFLK